MVKLSELWPHYVNHRKTCAIQLHYYTPQGEIGKGKFCLSANRSNPKELFEALRKNNLNNNRNGNDEMMMMNQMICLIPN
ncbi:hypothetical protein Glove_71g48 [Diversispora epigaea]|uniref:Uncharacterized protein n=1 Tax=Diversispora epigaea TaxID=1348612 RepID=A0A397JIT6_9GLOM|nr:hypothetical protein Glove_71g48 [Diversispora epigaea]